MKYSEETMLAFYQQLGKVFYAVAAADKIISKEEIRVLRNIVRSEWLKFDQTFDEFGTDSAYQIEIVFDWLIDKKVNAATAISDLESFVKDHPSLFTSVVKNLVIKTLTTIINSFNGDSIAEQSMLNDIQNVMGEV